MEDRQWFVLYVLICVEVGIFLVFVPWSAIWERNYFLENYPGLRPLVLSSAFRGAVCGLGFGNIYLAVHEVMTRLKQSGPGGPSGERAQPPTPRRRSPSEREEALAAPDEP